MERVTLNVLGMSCEHCTKSIETAVGALNGITEVSASLSENTVTFSYNPNLCTVNEVKSAIEEQGFDVED